MTKAVHMTSVHRADDVRIYAKECLSLRDAGYDVVLVARAPGANVNIRVPLYEVRTGAGNRFKRMTRTVFDVGRIAFRIKADLYHFHDPELLPLGLVLRAAGKKVIYDAHENLPKQIRSKTWLPKPLRGLVAKVVDFLERTVVGVLNGVVVATPGIGQRFSSKRTYVIQNFPRQDEYSLVTAIPYEERGKVAVYIGGLTETRGVTQMVQAFERLPDARLKLAGKFMPSSYHENVKKMPGIDAVEVCGWLDRTGVMSLLAGARVGLLTLLPTPNHIDSQPIKLFEYMGAGLPVVASDFPYWKQFVEDLGTGLMVDPTNPDAIGEAIAWLLDHPDEAKAMGQRGRKAVLGKYNWETESDKLLQLYESLIGPPKAPIA